MTLQVIWKRRSVRQPTSSLSASAYPERPAVDKVWILSTAPLAGQALDGRTLSGSQKNRYPRKIPEEKSTSSCRHHNSRP
jgi:hypothetical protein